ncbi:hypothetical protein Cni_G18930 [Canna indica]|uniref:Uncharacterized protein n=1 Tax=Canna indica TaxID=4628 RepID=A0AAQ3QEV5_9LILI|nr:hypothetical protein Cni_G18930 [Canna indica]
MTVKVSSLVLGGPEIAKLPPARELSWSSRTTRSNLPRLCCAASEGVSSRKMRHRRKRKRRSSAPEEGKQTTEKGSLRAKGQKRDRRSFQWLWPPPARSINLPKATMWNGILRRSLRCQSARLRWMYYTALAAELVRLLVRMQGKVAYGCEPP